MIVPSSRPTHRGKTMTNDERRAGRGRLLRSACVSAAVAAVAGAHLLWPGRIDAIFLALLGLALLPWLAPYVSRLRLGDLEVELRAVKHQLAETQGVARSAYRAAETLT